ncbi:hypothetical protein [Streptomyces broussonetiae]|uniref:hypothetical protein n=1 Tax=Streptomyces broussonetiae TaxID=2686304 RepID=UPI0035DF2D43
MATYHVGVRATLVELGAVRDDDPRWIAETMPTTRAVNGRAQGKGRPRHRDPPQRRSGS